MPVLTPPGEQNARADQSGMTPWKVRETFVSEKAVERAITNPHLFEQAAMEQARRLCPEGASRPLEEDLVQAVERGNCTCTSDDSGFRTPYEMYRGKPGQTGLPSLL